jgi:hypothetical protein
MEEEFYATLKLTSGEEIIAKVCYLTDENSLLVEYPMLVERVKHKKIGKTVEGFSLKEWISATYETLFVIKMEQVVTMTELDKKIEGFYLKHLDKNNDDEDDIVVKPKNFSKGMGYLGSVTETKKYLEDIFNRS